MQLINLKKAFFELIINSVFGKTMENLRKRITVELINNGWQQNFSNHTKLKLKPFSVSQDLLQKLSWKLLSDVIFPSFLGSSVIPYFTMAIF